MKDQLEIKGCIKKVTEGSNLTEKESEYLMRKILAGELTSAQLASLIVAMKMKGETVDEITGFARVMREKSKKINLDHKTFATKEADVEGGLSDSVIDTCGTGGDISSTFNISTACAIVVSGCGLKVAKHGNRAVSSSCGSADILEELGVEITTSPEKTKECIEKVGLGFLYAPIHHEAMKHAKEPRREMGIKTVFNVLGPLTNPAGAKRQLIGVYDESLTEVMAEVLKKLGSKKAWVVHGLDGMDEITMCEKTKVTELDEGEITTFYLNPSDYGKDMVSPEELAGGDKNYNAGLILDILNGKKGPSRDIVVLNSAAALVVGEKAKDLKEGMQIVEAQIDKGAPLEKLNMLKSMSKERGVV
ncbi:anthranilate phosphoribosyltransferase [Natranaerofaba carboxydovora]|uniref:anthranilate phosphoribosyltransferase n=1 Tax=Natranaerofaba carboxydovora TaxID=2742683 RepID=UPI001F140DBD|nr:anthranilate phosphoribosyltransferase [Natranaerofaba carboxydovora]UMZ72605.1 Anthranilate phosphoribosyltransferase [Natranaerofaba carboxydovora]